ncbi:type II toxin-antitoxin system HicA family toxin [Clostridium tagluense]|uniref:type II toxin-antitoxin system HicA family toxin n=1 Tax=Clostridium tagluense TaxID=360422 RepID=UPI001C6E3515|nr:type II toxin-antitoxin system HicA family toxin [Clostridium tagluense]MBW9158977.1 type II toxin-antitoxin system HicA family toxin [Clostridium tagluense]WLC68371.1 type II toxin-antitoxin system HicA family toxin [Clostridium tagluense]
MIIPVINLFASTNSINTNTFTSRRYCCRWMWDINRHSADIPTGTLRNIWKQAGWI